MNKSLYECKPATIKANKVDIQRMAKRAVHPEIAQVALTVREFQLDPVEFQLPRASLAERQPRRIRLPKQQLNPMKC